MIRYITLLAVALLLSTSAVAQQQVRHEASEAEQQAMAFVEEIAQHLAKDAEAYIDRLSFPVQVSVVTGEGEVLTGSFSEQEFRMLGHLPGDQIRVHAAQHALLRQMQQMMGQRAEAEERTDEETFVQEELALMPRDKVIEETQIRTMNTRVEVLNDNVVFARTTLAIGPEQAGERGETYGMAEEIEGEDETLVEEERAARPQEEPQTAHLDLGLLMVKENGEWKVKSIITSDARIFHR